MVKNIKIEDRVEHIPSFKDISPTSKTPGLCLAFLVIICSAIKFITFVGIYIYILVVL